MLVPISFSQGWIISQFWCQNPCSAMRLEATPTLPDAPCEVCQDFCRARCIVPLLSPPRRNNFGAEQIGFCRWCFLPDLCRWPQHEVSGLCETALSCMSCGGLDFYIKVSLHNWKCKSAGFLRISAESAAIKWGMEELTSSPEDATQESCLPRLILPPIKEKADPPRSLWGL